MKNETNRACLLITMNYPPPFYGGSSIYLSRLATNLPYKNIRVLTSSKGNPDEEKSYDEAQQFETVRVPVVFSYKMAFSIWAKIKVFYYWFLALWKHIERESISVVALENVFYLGVPTRIICALRGIPYIVFTFGEELTKDTKENISLRGVIRRFIYKWTLGGATKLISVSQPTAQLLGNFGVSESKVVLIHPSTDVPEKLPEQAIIEEYLRKYSLNGKRILASVGNFIPRKGFDKLIQALPFVIEKHPDIELVIVGSGPMENLLKRISQDLSISEKIHFFGRISRDELSLLYASCELFALITRVLPDGEVEGCPTVFIEANAYAKPVVGGRSGGTEDAIKHMETGILVDSDNLSEIAEAICKLLDEPDTARSMGQAGREWVQKYRSPESSARKLLEVINDVIEESKY